MMMMMRVLTFFIALSLSLSIGQQLQIVMAAELIEKSMEHDGLIRWFLEYKPDNYVANAPVVILLHGGTGSMRVLFQRGRYGSKRWLDVCSTNGFLLLAPNGVNIDTGDTYGDDQTWSDLRLLNNPNNTIPISDDVGFLSKLVQYSINEHNVNPMKVYITGASNGGLMTYTMLVKQPNLFAAGAAFIANIPDVIIETPNQTTPLMIMNGNKDRLMKWNGGELPSQVAGIMRSALATRDFWITNNQASITNVIKSTLPNRNFLDRCRIRSEFYPASNSTTTNNGASAPVHFYIMDGGGHSVPSRRGFLSILTNVYDLLIGGPTCHDINGADVAWSFLSSYTYFE
jgi:polyhydroxybutyrate depolymerase